MKSLIVRFPDQLFEELKQNKVATGTSLAEYVRRAVRLALFADKKAEAKQ